MLAPTRVKYRKPHLKALRGYAKGANKVDFGEYGLQALANGWITARQIEAVRVAVSRKMKKGGKIWIRIFPDRPVTRKPLETRMGKGKGNVEYWTAAVKRGRVMFEIAGVDEQTAREALRLAAHKLPLKSKIMHKEVEGGESNEG